MALRLRVDAIISSIVSVQARDSGSDPLLLLLLLPFERLLRDPSSARRRGDILRINESSRTVRRIVGVNDSRGPGFHCFLLIAKSSKRQGMPWLGPYLLLFSAVLMEFAAQSAKGICHDVHPNSEELSPIREDTTIETNEHDRHGDSIVIMASPRSPSRRGMPQFCIMLDGFWLILSSTYLLCIALFIWLSAVVSSFFYFQKMTIIATTVTSPLGRRRMLAEINSFIAIFILAGQLTMTGHILTTAGVTTAICSAPLVAFSSMITLSVWPTWITVAITETL